MERDYIDFHCHHPSPEASVYIINQLVTSDLNLHPQVQEGSTASIGIHPWFVSEETFEKQWSKLEYFFESGSYFAFGECGLDRLKGPDIAFQIEILTRHCKFAEEKNKPVILHIVRAISDLLDLQKRFRFKTPMIIHGFRGNSYEASQLIRYGFYLSFGEALLHSSTKLHEAFVETPVERIFLETDTSEVSIAKIYEKAAALKRITIEALAREIKHNFEELK